MVASIERGPFVQDRSRAVFRSGFSQPAGVHDVELGVDLPPVFDGHGPFFRQSLDLYGEPGRLAWQGAQRRAARSGIEGIGGLSHE